MASLCVIFEPAFPDGLRRMQQPMSTTICGVEVQAERQRLRWFLTFGAFIGVIFGTALGFLFGPMAAAAGFVVAVALTLATSVVIARLER